MCSLKEGSRTKQWRIPFLGIVAPFVVLAVVSPASKTWLHIASWSHSWLHTPLVPITLAIVLLYKTVEVFGTRVFDEASSPSSPDGHLYTRIRGKWYDLADFAHPGGPIALKLAEGRDGTALFESHHYLISHTKLRKILSKFAVSDEKAKNLKLLDPDDGAHYIWEGFEDDPFVKDIRALAVQHFAPIAQARQITLRKATKATPQRWLMIFALMLAFFVTIPNFVLGRWWTLLLTPQLAWVTIANYWHDGLHFSLSCDWRINAILPYLFPWLSSPWMWYHQHVVGHHAYTNIGHKDPDLAHAPQLMREHLSIQWKSSHINQGSWPRLAIIWSVSVGIGVQILNDIKTNVKLSYNNVVPYAKLKRPRMVAHVIGRAVYVWSLFVWPFVALTPWKAITWSIVPITLFSWSFMLNTQINHLNEACCHASSTNFLKHQIVTSQNFGIGSTWHHFFSGGLNYQIEHHLFPSVNHCHLPNLAPKVKAICMKHGVAYNEVAGYREALQQHVAHIVAMGAPPTTGAADLGGKST